MFCVKDFDDSRNIRMIRGWQIIRLMTQNKKCLQNKSNQISTTRFWISTKHDDVMKWKHFPHYWSFVRGIPRSPVKSPHKGQWRGAFMFSLVYAWINRWVNNREAGDMRRCRAHYDVIVMRWVKLSTSFPFLIRFLYDRLGLYKEI